MIEAQLAWRPLDNLEVALYGNNLTDRTHRVYAFGAGGGAAFAQVAAGRAAGIRIDLSW